MSPLFSRLLIPKTCCPAPAAKFQPAMVWSPAVSAVGSASSTPPWKIWLRTPVLPMK